MTPADGGAVKSRMRFAQWVLSNEKSGGPPIHAAECVDCHESSEGADDWEGPQMWCLRHAGRTGHVVFRATVTSFFRATLKEVL